MGEIKFGTPVAGLASKDKIMPDDVLMLRREVFSDGVVTRGEAGSLFALDAAAVYKCPEWDDFFIEAMTDHIVRQSHPQGYVTEDDALWLVSAISEDGRVDTRTEIEMLVRIIEAARSVPASLSAFALKQVAMAVVEGEGPLAKGRSTLTRGAIQKAEVDLMRRVLYAFGGGGNIAVTREEAEILFDLNDRTIEAANDPSWNELFVKAIVSQVMAVSGRAAPTREQALAREVFLDDLELGIGKFFARMVSGGFSAMRDSADRDHGMETWHREQNAEFAAAVPVAERITEGEAAWLAARIGRDGVLHENEKALLAFLKAESPDIHPALSPLLAKVA